MPKHITDETKLEIINYYKSKPTTIAETAKQFSVSDPSVIKILNEYGIKRYSKAKLFSPNLDETYFESIDTETKAYFLGLIITDGCIHKSENRPPLLALMSNASDSYIIKQFLDDIHSNNKLTSDNRGCLGVHLMSERITNSLEKYGVKERKTFDTKFPALSDKSMYPHLIRGILDGDGSVGFYARKGRNAHDKKIRFTGGTKSFLAEIGHFLHEELALNIPNIYRDKENVWIMQYRKNKDLEILIHYLYDNAHIYLKRKKYICDLILNEIKQNTENTGITTLFKSTVAS